jgi:hypothetical protein
MQKATRVVTIWNAWSDEIESEEILEYAQIEQRRW